MTTIHKPYVTPAEAAILTKRGERTIRRWMTGRLLTIYKTSSGRVVLDRLEVARVAKQQCSRNPVRHAVRAQRFAQVAAMTYSDE
jgi:hypothetical protein